MKSSAAVLLALFTTIAAAANQDPRAVAVARAMRDAMGGDAGWQKARFFRFDFVVVRDGTRVASFSHWWDRFDGRYRVEGTRKDGAAWKAYFNVNTKQGVYFLNGSKTDGETLRAGLEEAYGRFINDTYWMLAPWKTFDPGVNLDYVGDVKDGDGHDCDEIKLSFDNVGLTPKDIYWMDVEKATHRMTQWKYVLDGGTEAPTVARWGDWRRFGSIELSTVKTMAARPVEIRIENLTVSETPDDGALTPPR